MFWFVDESGNVVNLTSLDPSQYQIEERDGSRVVHVGRQEVDGFDVEGSFDLHEIKTIDCTPPDNLPDIVIVLDRKHGEFWLLVQKENGSDGYTLSSPTLPGARVEARAMGFEPEAWIDDLGILIRF